MKYLFVGILVLLPAAPIWAKLEISKIEPALGQLGPERKSLDFYPLDEIMFRYQVAGVKTGADGKTDVEIEVKLVNPFGKNVFDKKTTVLRQLSLGANTFPAYAILPVPEKAPPGEYTLTVQITDRLAKESETFERKLTCKPVSFQIVDLRFWRDADFKVPAPAGGLLGETIHFKLRVIGFDKSKKKVQTALTVTVLDDAGKPIPEKPLVIKAGVDNADDAAKATQVNYNGLLYLNRTGNFTLRFSVEDSEGKQTTAFETPFKVSAP